MARDQFVTHFTAGDFRISLRAAKPKTSAIHLAAEMELLRNLEQTHTAPDARVRGVIEDISKTDESFEALLGAVKGLRQEVKTIQPAVQVLKRSPSIVAPPRVLSNPPMNPNADSVVAPGDSSRLGARSITCVCWCV